ncbi:hypothetical protein DFS34DRAFT_602480 [Phlyctochytrium arcticum]|nr:hypothetical protein DFS34DRAFT_602480 [Phlyctochytrium arcticum]
MSTATAATSAVVAAPTSPTSPSGEAAPPSQLDPPVIQQSSHHQQVPDRQSSSNRRRQVTKLTIHIEEDRTIFTPGQRVEGHLVLDLPMAFDIKLLRVRFAGTVQTQLYKADSSIAAQNASNICLFKEIQTFIGSAVPGEPLENVAAGSYRYPFAFRVPPTQLPASFEGPYGCVKYEVAAVLVRPTHANLLTAVNLTIPSTLDATDPDLAEPISARASGSAGIWWWKSGHLEVEVSTPRSAYASEEVVPIKIDIINHSGSGAVLKDVYLKQRVMYKTMNESRGPKTDRIHRLSFSEQYPSSIKRINRIINFPIPSTNIMSPTISTGILEVFHVLIIKVASKARWSKPFKIELPLTIAGFPVLYFDATLIRASIDTLPPYERRQSVVSRLSGVSLRRARRRSRTTSNQRSEDGIGPDWEPSPVSSIIPPVPIIPPQFIAPSPNAEPNETIANDQSSRISDTVPSNDPAPTDPDSAMTNTEELMERNMSHLSSLSLAADDVGETATSAPSASNNVPSIPASSVPSEITAHDTDAATEPTIIVEVGNAALGPVAQQNGFYRRKPDIALLRNKDSAIAMDITL